MTSTEWLELGRRTGVDVDVSLLWNSSLNRIKVAVSDTRICHHLDFDLADANALRAFSEPFGEAATRLQATDLAAALSRRATDEFWGFGSS